MSTDTLLDMLPPNEARVTVASGDPLDVRHFSVEERMSELFRIEVLAVSTNLDVDLDEVVGQAASFSLGNVLGLERWTGICLELAQVRVDDQGLATYRLVLVPDSWRLTQRTNYRIFQYKSEIEIVAQILGEWGVAHEVRCSAHKRRKYRTQYGESDFTFIQRMLEDAATCFYFERSGDGSILVLDDAPETRGVTSPGLRFHDAPTVTEGQFVTEVHVRSRLRPGGQAIGDVDYRRASTKQPRLATRAGLPQEAALEQFDFEPGAFLFEASSGGNSPSADDRGTARTDEATGARKVEARLHGARSDARVVELTSDVLALAPGRILSTLDHPHRLLAAPLLVTGTSLSGEHSSQWRVRAHTVPTTSPHRPARKTPRPTAHGLESATVVGPAGEEIHTDEFGRVRVHFHWDRESKRDETSSCWLPTNQPWAGQGYGGVNLPRIGQEVLVEFLGADPDRPVVIGRVYTATNPVPDPLPKYKHVAGLFSESTPRMVMGGAGPGGAGANQSIFGGTPMTPAEMASNATAAGPLQVVSPTGTNHAWQGSGFKLDDMSGAENAYIQANRDMHWVVHNNWTTVVGAHRTALIGTDEITYIQKNQKVYVGSDQTTVVQKNQGNQIMGKRTDSVGEKYTLFAAEGIKLDSVDDSIRITAEDSLKLDSDTTIELRVKNSLIKIQNSMISAGSGGDQVHINPTRQADSPDPPPDQATIDRGVAALDQYRQSFQGQQHPPSPRSGENHFAREAMREAGVTDRAAQDAALQQYWSRPSSGSIDLR